MLYELGPGTSETATGMSPGTADIYTQSITPLAGGNRAPLGNILPGNRTKVEQKFASPNVEMFNQLTT